MMTKRKGPQEAKRLEQTEREQGRKPPPALKYTRLKTMNKSEGSGETGENLSKNALARSRSPGAIMKFGGSD